jgi:tetratricopeptide (TPR) repeat protein
VNEAFNKRSVAPALIRLVILLFSLGIARVAYAGGDEQQVCDVRADYALGIEDYPEAIRLHAAIVRRHPDDALARYHLGFAEGMMGNRTAELSEYQRAAALGIRNWNLFLNLGLVEFQNGDLDAAADSLRRATLFGEDHRESHYNLALVDERRGQFAEAEREMRASLRLDPSQPDALNALGVLYAEEGKTDHASQVWRELLREAPDYAPARKNLSLVGGPSVAASGETAAVVLPPRRPPSTPSATNRDCISRRAKPSRDRRNQVESNDE